MLEPSIINQLSPNYVGAAVATLDAMFLTENLDPSISMTTSVFGLPRVGDQAWADFVDASVCVILSSRLELDWMR